MKKSSVYVFITAVAAYACFCGILFFTSSPISSLEESYTTESKTDYGVFSLEKAQDMITLCSVSYESQKLESLLAEKNYQNFEYFQRNGSDGIAAGIALEESSDYTKITVVFRGTFEEEWYSNFRIGENIEHRGFASAAEYACNQIKDYILRNKKDNTKVILELTGHSRGGAVANLTAKNFIEQGLMQEVYAYTFASPNTTTSPDAASPVYGKIYNIINPEDFICYIPLEKWGYTKYGVKVELPVKASPEYSQSCNSVAEIYNLLTGKSFCSYEGGNEDVNRFITACSEIAPSLKDYYQREIIVGPYTITLSEYMDSAATLLSGDKDLTSAMLLISGSTSEELAPITNFITAGIDPEKMDENTDFTQTPIGCGHSCEIYLAWLRILDEGYFINKISE